jgi:uncharacterized protein (TIGR02145 family)
VTGTINVVPTITRSTSGGDASQTVIQNTAITPIIYTASNATSIAKSSSGDFQTGVTGTPNGLVFTIEGTPSATGTYNYSVTAYHTNGCTSAASSGVITVNSVATTPTHAKTTTTWTVSGNGGAQTWSDVINVPACNKNSYSASNSTADCRANSTTALGYLYSWVYVTNNASTLCDNGWRVPTNTDYCNLDKSLIGTTTCDNRWYGNEYAIYDSSWGSYYGGMVNSKNELKNQASLAYYWTSSEYDSEQAYFMEYNASYTFPQSYNQKWYGFQVRCVK